MSHRTLPQRKAVSDETRRLQKRAHDLIPGGAHTYAKGDDQYPLVAPPFIERGEGCHVWDLDGNEYVEYGMGLRAVTLGHAYPSVVEAALRELRLGHNFTRPSSLETRAAELLADLIPSAEMVKFAKNGSDATTAAVKLARAWTGRELVANCSDQAFFSTDDWFIGTTPMSAGIPEAIRDLTVGFPFNDLAALRSLFEARGHEIACLIMEPETSVAAEPGYLGGVQSLCREHGVLFVLDEMITGFRWSNGGAQLIHGLAPDLSTFGKGLSNGFPVAALVGRRDIMELGGLRHDRARVFLLSTTNGAEHGGLGAAMESMRIYRDEPVTETLRQQGERLKKGAEEAADAMGVASHFKVFGHPANLVFATLDPDGSPSQEYRTLFLQEMIMRGVLGPSFVVSYSHGDDDIDFTIDALTQALAVYRQALDQGSVDGFLQGSASKRVFRTYN